MNQFDPTEPSNADPSPGRGGWAMPDSVADSSSPPWVTPEQGGSTTQQAEPGGASVDVGTDAGHGDGDDAPHRQAERPRLPVALRPMTVSDLLDGGFAILKARPGSVFGAAALIVVPLYAVQVLLSRGVVDSSNINALFTADPTSRSSGAANGGEVVSSYLGQGIATMAVLLVGCVLARMVSAWYAGGEITMGEAFKSVLKALPTILVAWFFMLILNVISLLVLCIGWFFLNPLFMVVAPVIMIEGLGPIAAMKRSVQLVGRRYFWVVLYDLCVSVMAYIAANALTLIPQALGVALPKPWNWVALGAGQTVVALIIVPAVAGVAVLLYLDLRIRSEGLDLELKASEAFAGAA